MAALPLLVLVLLTARPAAGQQRDPQADARLLSAVLSADTAGVARELAVGADPNYLAEDEWTPLHWAAYAPMVPPPYPVTPGALLLEKDYLPILRLLIHAGTSLQARSDDGDTPLHTAARRGLPEIVQLLVQSGADVNRRGAQGHTPLRAALQHGPYNRNQLATASMLIRLGARSTPVEWREAHLSLYEEMQYLQAWLERDDPAAPSLPESYLTLLEQFAGANDLTLLDGRRAVAKRYYENREYARAQMYLQRLLEDLGALGRAPDPLRQGAARVLLGQSLRGRGQLSAARAALEQGVAELRRAAESREGGNGAVAYLSAGLQDLAMLLLHEGDAAAARRLLDEARQARARIRTGQAADDRPLLHRLAHVHLASGDPASATRLLREIIRDTRRSGGDEVQLIRPIRDLAFAMAFSGPEQCAEAMDTLVRAVDTHARFLHEQAFSDQAPLLGAALSEQQVALENEARLGADLLSLPCGGSTVHDSIYERIARSKGTLLDYVRIHNEASIHSPFIGDNWRGLAELRALRAQLTALTVNLRPHASPDRRRILYDSLSSVRESWEGGLSWRVGAGNPIRQRPLDERHTVRSLLDTGEVMVDVYRYDAYSSPAAARPRYAAFVVPSAGPIRRVDLGDAAVLDTLLAAWRDASVAGDPTPAAFTSLVRSAWLPIAAALPMDARRVWISPDGQLSRLPWPALTQGAPDTEGLLISILDAPRQLRRPGVIERPDAPGRSLLLVGGVDFGAGTRFAPLAGTQTELDSLLRLAAEARLDVTVRRGAEATVPRVREDLQRARYAHVATHGFFIEQQSSGPQVAASRAPVAVGMHGGGERSDLLLSSGLVLAGANEGPAGLLSAEDLLGMDLRGVQLVVLSACDTGRGQELTGQGVMGLRASLIAAGADAVLMSLWKVPDESTAVFMQAFYKHLSIGHLAPAEALQRAAAEVRDHEDFGAPLHWAGWVLAGQAW